jgi:sec-independent protein translocase protein TatB
VFGIGGQELILLCLIGLIVLGPEKLPRVANQIGNWLGQARRMTRVLKRQLEEEIDLVKKADSKPPPSAREPSRQPPAIADQSTPRDDDDYSPEHAAGEPGTGIGDDLHDEAADLAVPRSETESVSAGIPPADDMTPVPDKKAVS